MNDSITQQTNHSSSESHPSRMTQVQHTFKVVIAGDSGVGKTEFSTVNSMAFQIGEPGSKPRRPGDWQPTIGVDFVTTLRTHDVCAARNQVHTKCTAQHKRVGVRYTIWDTAGTEHFRSCIRQYFRTADVVIFAYDLTRKSTFDSLQDYWWPMIQELSLDQCRYFVVGTKADKLGSDDDRQVAVDAAKQFARRIGALEAFETDAVREGGRRAYETFNCISEMVVNDPPPAQEEKLHRLQIQTPVVAKKKTCKCNR